MGHELPTTANLLLNGFRSYVLQVHPSIIVSLLLNSYGIFSSIEPVTCTSSVPQISRSIFFDLLTPPMVSAQTQTYSLSGLLILIVTFVSIGTFSYQSFPALAESVCPPATLTALVSHELFGDGVWLLLNPVQEA